MKPEGLHAPLTQAIIESALEVHRVLGPGLLESVYEEALCIELHERNLSYQRQEAVTVTYKSRRIALLRPDLVVDQAVVVEVKSVERFDPVFLAQMLTYLQITNLRVGLILNFNLALLKTGIRRVVL